MSKKRPRGPLLVVEGPNDRHSILHFLRGAGVLPKDATEDNSPVYFWEAQSKPQLLDDIPVGWKQTGTTSIGYVLDADDQDGDPPGLQPTWDAVRGRLPKCVDEPPQVINSGGFVGTISPNGPRIGVWIMPDNQHDGALEEFLIPMVDRSNRLWQYAQSSTAEAPQHGAAFSPGDQSKAELACWLAWQDEPGQTYGVAMRAGRFSIRTPTAAAFEQWVRDLFQLHSGGDRHAP